jgi:hypothetical protein
MSELIAVLELVWDAFKVLLPADAKTMALTVLPLFITLAGIRALL